LLTRSSERLKGPVNQKCLMAWTKDNPSLLRNRFETEMPCAPCFQKQQQGYTATDKQANILLSNSLLTYSFMHTLRK